MPRFDTLDAAGISRHMATIRKSDTKPELIVRRLVHAMGYRFRLHRRDLPGTPDLVLPKHRKVIFVHGCFWHRHDCPAGRKVPGKNRDYWMSKLERNCARDRMNVDRLEDDGWECLTVWECQLRDRKAVEALIRCFLLATSITTYSDPMSTKTPGC